MWKYVSYYISSAQNWQTDIQRTGKGISDEPAESWAYFFRFTLSRVFSRK